MGSHFSCKPLLHSSTPSPLSIITICLSVCAWDGRAENNAEIEQIFSIFKVLGTPTTDTWADAQGTQYWHHFPNFPRLPRESWVRRARVPVPDRALDLLENLLDYDSTRRYTAKQAYAHSFLQLFTQPQPPS